MPACWIYVLLLKYRYHLANYRNSPLYFPEEEEIITTILSLLVTQSDMKDGKVNVLFFLLEKCILFIYFY